jgi:YD repeat-containing protein
MIARPVNRIAEEKGGGKSVREIDKKGSRLRGRVQCGTESLCFSTAIAALRGHTAEERYNLCEPGPKKEIPDTYDSNGNKTSSTYPATVSSKNTTSYIAYNQYSEQTSATDELGNVRTFNYDANYLPHSTTDSLGVVASYLFNANGTLQAGATGYDLTAQPAMASQYTYDTNGNMASTNDALGRTTSYAYNPLGNKIAMTQPLPTSDTGNSSSTTTYQYDAFGNLIQTVAPQGRTTSSQYDPNGNRISNTDSLGNVTTYQYDALNRLTTTTYPTQTPTSSILTYDFRNNVITSTDQNGNVTLNTYLAHRPPVPPHTPMTPPDGRSARLTLSAIPPVTPMTPQAGPSLSLVLRVTHSMDTMTPAIKPRVPTAMAKSPSSNMTPASAWSRRSIPTRPRRPTDTMARAT